VNPILQKLQSQAIVDFCHHWQIVNLAAFGSVLSPLLSAESAE